MVQLAEFLEKKHLTFEQVSAKTGLPVSRIHEIANTGRCSLQELRLLSRKLKMPARTSATSSQKPEYEKVQVLLRATTQTSGAAYELIEGLTSQLSALVALSSDLPPNSLWIEEFKDAVGADQAAARFRELHFENDQLSPMYELPRVLARKLDLNLVVYPDLPVEGVSARLEQQLYVLVSPRKFKPRMLFTLAHELGHFAGGHHDSDFAAFDLAQDLNPWRSRRSQIEAYANAFASALLLPEVGVHQAILKVRKHFGITGPLGDIEISYLARFFGVSFEVAGRRCEALGLLPEYGARALYDHVRDKHGNPEKRADGLGLPARDEIKFTTSKRLLDAASEKIERGEWSLGKAVEVLRVGVADLFRAHAESER